MSITLPGDGDKVATTTNTSTEHVQHVRQMRSDDPDQPVVADADGQRVNLGSNNDVTVTSGAVNATLQTGSAAIGKLAANSGVDIGDVDARLLAGTNYVGKVSLTDDTNDITLVPDGGGTYPSVPTSLVADGEPLSFALPLPASVSPTMDAATYTAGASLQDAAFSISNATTAAGRTCHLLGLRIIDKDDQGDDLQIYFFRTTVSTVPAAQDAFTLDDTDSVKVCGFIDTSTDGVWVDLGGSSFWQMTRSPIPLLTTATTLYILCKTLATPTYTASGLVIEPTLARD